MHHRTYYSKILLFGEYAIIRGSKALAIPFPAFSGAWAQAQALVPSDRQNRLLELVDWLEDLQSKERLLAPLNLSALRRDLESGFYFQSNIPVGYGVGSSGALTAAIYEGYAERVEPDLQALQKQLAQIEGFFHGSSSGADPLVSLVNHPLLLAGKGQVERVRLPDDNPDGDGALFLLDTRIQRETAPLVRIFLGKCENIAYDLQIENEFGVLTNLAIRSAQEADWPTLDSLFKAISQFQWDHFLEMIPPSCQADWQEGLRSETYHLKLCGAGGGGFLLGYASDFAAARQELRAWDIVPVIRF